MNNNTNNSQGGVVLGNITNSTLNPQPEPMPNNFTNNVAPTNPVITPNTIVDNPSYLGQQNISDVQGVQQVNPQPEQPVENLTFNSSIPDTLPNTNVVQEPVMNNNVAVNPVDTKVGYSTNFEQANNVPYATNSVNMNDNFNTGFNTNQTVNSVNMNQGFDINSNYNANNNMMDNIPPVTPINNFGNDVLGSEPTIEQNNVKNKKGHGFLIFVLIIVILGLCAGAAWYFFLKDKFVKQNPKEVYVKVLNSMNTDVSLLDDFKTSSGNISLSVNPKNNAIKKFDLNIISTIDKDANYFQFGLDTRYNDESALAGDIFYTNNKLYIKADELYSNLLEVDSSDLTFNFNTSANTSNSKVIIDSIISAVKDAFKDEYFTQNVEDNVTINKLTLTNDSYVTFMTDILNNLKANNNYVKEIANINSFSEDEVKRDLDDQISELEGKNIEISVYTGSSKSVSKVVMDFKDDKTVITIDNIIDNGFNYNINVDGSVVSGKVAINLSGQTQTVKITIDTTILTITLDASFEKNATVTKAEIIEENVTKISELTDYDKGMIQINLMSNEALLNLMNDLNNISKLLPINDKLSLM